MLFLDSGPVLAGHSDGPMLLNARSVVQLASHILIGALEPVYAVACFRSGRLIGMVASAINLEIFVLAQRRDTWWREHRR